MQCSIRSGWRSLRLAGLRPSKTLASPRSRWRNGSGSYQVHRHFGLDVLTTILVPPAVFGGLLISLWTYKCIMMVVFQNKIIYMPGVPPFSRSEKVEDYATQCRPVRWSEHKIKSLDGTTIKVLEGNVQSDGRSVDAVSQHVVVLYLQGNASSLPPRLPYLSRIITAASSSQDPQTNTRYTLYALSYRGFWTSSGRPSQPGIELDVEATIEWLFDGHRQDKTKFILWGQSIGAGAASVGLSNLALSQNGATKLSRVSGLLLETPFVDLRTMLIALYPQKFLPYRYLAPFLRSTWDSKTALATVGDTAPRPHMKILMLQAGDDELVPDDNAAMLEQTCREKGLAVDRLVVTGALHTEVMAKSQGRILIANFIRSIGQG